MLVGRAFESPRALDGAEGELGDTFANPSNICAEDCEVATSMSGGLLPAAEFSPDGDGFGFVGEDGASEVGERGPPHCDINERTGQVRQLGCGRCQARTNRRKQGNVVSGSRTAAGADPDCWIGFKRTTRTRHDCCTSNSSVTLLSTPRQGKPRNPEFLQAIASNNDRDLPRISERYEQLQNALPMQKRMCSRE